MNNGNGNSCGKQEFPSWWNPRAAELSARLRAVIQDDPIERACAQAAGTRNLLDELSAKGEGGEADYDL